MFTLPDGLFKGTAHGVDDLRVGVKRSKVMGGQGVEVELLAQVLAVRNPRSMVAPRA